MKQQAPPASLPLLPPEDLPAHVILLCLPQANVFNQILPTSLTALSTPKVLEYLEMN